jgi:hypothetical protein
MEKGTINSLEGSTKKGTREMNNICLGYKAGIDLTTERLQLCIKLEGFDEIRTTMTQEEYEVINSVVKRLFGKAQEK